MSSLPDTHGINEPCREIEMSTRQKTMLKMSFSKRGLSVIAIMANTIDAAPLKPTKDMRDCCLKEYFLNGVRMPATARGLATNNMKKNIAIAGSTAL